MKIKNYKLKIIPTFLLFLFPIIVLAFTVPEKPTNFVNDYVGVLSSEQKLQLETKISDFEKQTTNEIAVVVIYSLDGDTIENVAQDIFTKWGIGKKDKNNGVLLLIAIEDRRTRIHTGYGVEGDLTDIGTSYIQREVITPAFQAGDYYAGINGAVDKMIESLRGTEIVPEGYTENSKSGFNFQYIIIIGFIALQWIAAILAKSKSWWGGGVLGGLVGGGIWYFFISTLFIGIPVFIILILIGLGFDYIVSKAYDKYKGNGTTPPWFLGGGGFGGGHSGGSFGGFGGGFSGGGGSSGRW